MTSVKKTVVNSMAYLGAAISEGQPKRGVERAPDEYRRAGLFEGLKKKFPVKKITDYGNITLESVQK
jgi:arginase family enzyme